MNDTQENLISEIEAFNMWDYPIFSFALGYVWIELINPQVGVMLQVIPRIPNAAWFLIGCYFLRPPFIRQIEVPFHSVRWALPFLVIATINIPFIQLERTQTVLDLISTWFWVLLLLPLQVRILSTPSGRWHFLFFSTIGVVLFALQYYTVLLSRDSLGILFLNYHNLAPGAILLIPPIIAYIYKIRGPKRYFLLSSLAVLAAVIIPAGARAMWIIIPIELALLGIFILPKRRMFFTGIVLSIILSLALANLDVSSFYSDDALAKFENRVGKTTEWREDNTVWTRLGIYKKTLMILQERPLLGVGFSNRSFAAFDAGDFEVFDHYAAVRKKDAHNTYLNIIGGTGILGLIAFAYFALKVFYIFRQFKLPVFTHPELGPYLISVVGLLLWYFLNTHPFAHTVRTASIILSIYVYLYHTEVLEVEDNAE
jgi:O-antigen ligase